MLPEIERFQHWLRRKAPNANTHIHYTSDLKLFFAWLGKPVHQVQVADVDAFIEQCLQENQAFSTINRRLAALRSFFRFLMLESDRYPKNPVIPRRHFIRLGQQLPRDLQDPVVAQLFQVITGPRDRAMFLLMLRCGLHIGEVAGLLLADLYLDEPHPRLLVRGKGSRERTIFLSRQAERALRLYLAERPPAVVSNHVFLSYQLRGLSTTAIHDRVIHYRTKAEVHLTAHRLRHTFASDLVGADVPVTTIQKLLGHRWLETTQTYVAANDLQVQADYYAACEKLEGWL